jgi:hypothetical protein
MKPLAWCAGALLCAWAAAGHAQQSVYRCGADGRTYSQERCEAGRLIDVSDPRNAAQSTQTRQAAQRDAQLAEALRREREQAEHQATRQTPVIIGGAPKAVVHGPERCATHPAPCGAKKKSRHGTAADVTLYRAPQAR